MNRLYFGADCALSLAEIDALRVLSRRRWYAPSANAWGSMRVLCDLAALGLVSQCGRLFHASAPGDRAVERFA